MNALSNQSRDRLEQIAHVFRATHVFIRRQGCPHGNNTDVLSTWARVFEKNYSDCVSSIEELRTVEQLDRELYTTSLNYASEEQKIIHQEWDERHPLKLFINLHIEPSVSGNSEDQWLQYAEQVGLVIFDNKIYGKNDQGEPDANAQYKLPRVIDNLNKERDDAIATFAEVLLSM
jgi:hypothetical protein